jgi:hypothetical protein
LVDFRFDPRTQALVKTAEAREIVWRKADLIQDGHCRGTERVKLRAINLLQMDAECPSEGVL